MKGALRSFALYTWFFMLWCACAAYGSQECTRCHEGFVGMKSSFRFVHKPFLEGRCADCHQKKGDRHQGRRAARTSWRMRCELGPGTHLIPIDEGWQGRYVTIHLENVRGTAVREKRLPFRDTDELAEVPAQGTPEVEHLRVLGVERDIFLRATLVFQTSCPARCEIACLSDGVPQDTFSEDHYLTFHKVEFSGLRPNRRYQVSVIAVDPRGRKGVPATLSFVTDEASAVQGGGYDNPAPLQVEGLSLVKVGARPYLKLAVSSDSFLKLGPSGPVLDVHGKGSLGLKRGQKHPFMVSTYQAGYKNCLGCHEKETSVSHPVDIPPSPGMHPPRDFSLCNGKITCISCHDPHGTRYVHLLRRQQSVLCQGCHSARKYVLRR